MRSGVRSPYAPPSSRRSEAISGLLFCRSLSVSIAWPTFTDISKTFHARIQPKSALCCRCSGSSSPHSPVKLQKVSLERKRRYRHSDSNGGGCSRHGDTVYLLGISLQSIPASTCSHARLMASSLFVPVLGTGVPLSGTNAHKGGNNGYPSVSQTAARDRSQLCKSQWVATVFLAL